MIQHPTKITRTATLAKLTPGNDKKKTAQLFFSVLI
jgi:hypothetical protein